jgi:hypothetical protein
MREIIIETQITETDEYFACLIWLGTNVIVQKQSHYRPEETQRVPGS